MGGRPPLENFCFIKNGFSVLAGTADRRFRYGDYDFGVIAGSMHMARVLCSKSRFVLRKTYLAMFQ